LPFKKSWKDPSGKKRHKKVLQASIQDNFERLVGALAGLPPEPYIIQSKYKGALDNRRENRKAISEIDEHCRVGFRGFLITDRTEENGWAIISAECLL
jgi:hypothetical protein